MELHANAALTVPQRQEVRRLHREEGVSIRVLAERFATNPTTIQRWVARESPLDRSTAPRKTHSTITPEYRAGVVAYRQAHPRHGPIRIAAELGAEFPMAHRGTVLRILQEEQLTRPPQRQPREHQPLPVGRHRIQMDVQQLPAIAGSKGFEYKISAIHMRTRLKYSEIHPTCTSAVVAQVLRRALDQLPPFFSSGPTTPTSSP
jgi:hypothetical protein